MVKQLRRICAGTVRTRDRTWFTELSDKGMYFLDILIKNGISGYSARCTKVHLYWCMRNCPSTCNDHEHQQALSGLYLHSGWVCMCVCLCM